MLSVGDLVKKTQPAIFWCLRGIKKSKREALFTLFAFFRHIENIVSSAMPVEEKKELLNAWQEELCNIYEKQVPATNIGRKIYKNCLRFNLPQQQWEEILNSAKLNISKPLQAPSRLFFEQYLNGVSVVPFELALQIIDDKHIVANAQLAKDLGRAVFITYILRDVKDDVKYGRMYFPDDVLKRAGIEAKLPQQILESANFAYARQLLAGEAEICFYRAERLLSKMPKKNTLALRYVANVSRSFFDVMQKRGWEIMSPKPRLNWIKNIALLYKTIFK